MLIVFGQMVTLFFRGWVLSLGVATQYTILTVLGTVFYMAYFAIRETTSGQTLGKMTMSIKVFGPEGKPLTVGESLRRNIFGLSPLLVLLPDIGSTGSTLFNVILLGSVGTTIALDKAHNQGWHDRFAGGTQVRKVPRPVLQTKR